MKKSLNIIYFLSLFLVFYSCDREYDFLGDNVEAVSTLDVANISKSAALIKASLNTLNGSSLYEKGICYSTSAAPTIKSGKVKSDFYSDALGEFEVNVKNLQASTKYYVRAYATNMNGTAYGKELTFTTLAPSLALITTNSASNIQQTTALSGGNISDNGGATVTERGVVYSSSVITPTVNNTKVISGSGNGTFFSSLTGLTAGTTYYVRAYAITSAGASYGNTISFKTTSASIPSNIVTNAITNITANAGYFSGSVSTDGGAPIASRGFVYSNTTSTPILGTSSAVAIGSGVGSFNYTVTGLQSNTTYYVRSYATNSAGTAYGNMTSFTTKNSMAVGQPYNGGIIAYIFQSGDTGYISGQVHGLIIPTGSLPTYQWGCSGTNIPTNTALGYGNSNTNNIVSYCSTSSTAARYAYNLSAGGYSDWFLPSFYELQKIAGNGYLLNLPNSMVWTSSQYSTTSAYAINTYSGGYSTYSKSITFTVLPVRQF